MKSSFGLAFNIGLGLGVLGLVFIAGSLAQIDAPKEWIGEHTYLFDLSTRNILMGYGVLTVGTGLAFLGLVGALLLQQQRERLP